MKTHLGALALLFAAAVTTSVALADDARSSAAKDEAREAYALGTALAKQAQWHDAVAAFARAAALYPHAATSFNLAYSERALGHVTRARKYFRLALVQHEQTGKLSSSRVRQSRSYLSELDTKIVHVRVLVEPGMRLTVDGSSVEAEPPGFVALTLSDTKGTPMVTGSLEVLVDPGKRTFVGVHDDGRQERVDIDLTPGEKAIVDLRVAVATWPSRDLFDWSLVAMGAGASGLLTGAVFGVVALDKRAQLDQHCPSPAACPPQLEDDISALQRTARASTIAFSVGAVVSAAGLAMLVYHVLLPPSNHDAAVDVTLDGLRVRF